MAKQDISKIIRRLVKEYGDRQWKKRLDPVEELILTILSQNTSDTNSRRAYDSLTKTFGKWDDILNADTEAIAASIRTGGLESAKARYIRDVLMVLKKEVHDFDLTFLKGLTVEAAREWLLRLPGVGMKTASCVLLFSLGMPAFPVDTHVYRVAGRLGIISRKITANAAHTKMEKLTPPYDRYRFHVLLIEHGRKTCKARQPLCRNCVLGDICPSRKSFI